LPGPGREILSDVRLAYTAFVPMPKRRATSASVTFPSSASIGLVQTTACGFRRKVAEAMPRDLRLLLTEDSEILSMLARLRSVSLPNRPIRALVQLKGARCT